MAWGSREAAYGEVEGTVVRVSCVMLGHKAAEGAYFPNTVAVQALPVLFRESLCSNWCFSLVFLSLHREGAHLEDSWLWSQDPGSEAQSCQREAAADGFPLGPPVSLSLSVGPRIPSFSSVAFFPHLFKAATRERPFNMSLKGYHSKGLPCRPLFRSSCRPAGPKWGGLHGRVMASFFFPACLLASPCRGSHRQFPAPSPTPHLTSLATRTSAYLEKMV